MKNAVEHVGPQHPAGDIVLDLTVTEDETLLIAVTDQNPEFPGFIEAVSAQKSTGLPRVRELGGATTWRPSPDGDKKIVQVRLRPRSSLLADSP
ncbi:hypothetical protein ACFYXF_34940 [Streptomyces sp. NPDC002680]|uniref:hypothetical protein n=1 Tax=Streptomyces sp. NPDC002680 TaxID=3364659 RepID=UPI0036C1B09D